MTTRRVSKELENITKDLNRNLPGLCINYSEFGFRVNSVNESAAWLGCEPK